MPMYEYHCRSCEREFQKLRPMSAEAWSECPQCGSKAPRVLSMFAAPARSAVGVGAGASAGASCCGGGCACC